MICIYCTYGLIATMWQNGFNLNFKMEFQETITTNDDNFFYGGEGDSISVIK